MWRKRNGSRNNKKRCKTMLFISNYLIQRNTINSRDIENLNASLAHIACENGDVEMLKLLRDYGCEMEAVDKESATPLIYACQKKKLDVVRFLGEECKVNLEHVEFQNRTPLYVYFLLVLNLS